MLAARLEARRQKRQNRVLPPAAPTGDGMDFASDNGTGASPEILAAIAAANDGNAPAYGADNYTATRRSLAARDFRMRCVSFLVPTGTAANALALAALTPPWGAVFCH